MDKYNIYVFIIYLFWKMEMPFFRINFKLLVIIFETRHNKRIVFLRNIEMLFILLMYLHLFMLA